jgi:uncharacterized protein YciI
MKFLVLAIALISCSFAQAPSPSKKAFLIRTQPVRATFVQDATKEEEKIMSEHFVYLKKLAADGKVVLAGPSINGEKTFGLIVVEVDDEAEARKIMEGDPSLKAGIQKGEVLPFRISILRGR